MEEVRFNSYTKDWSWLSNFSPHPVKDFPTLEHAYQASKSIVPDDWEVVKRLQTPKEVKAWSYKIPFEHRRHDWEKIKEDVMYRAMKIKFQGSLALMLKNTVGLNLVHYAPWGDTYWGVDKNGQGQNRQGILLMKLRDELWSTR